jgi:glucose/arabinose dehydrogenase
VVRINPDGSIPPDSLFAGKAGAQADIWSLGHRNPLGAAIHPTTGRLWINEMGPKNGEELNIPEPGKNYGWPVVSNGDNYDGPISPRPPSTGTRRSRLPG